MHFQGVRMPVSCCVHIHVCMHHQTVCVRQTVCMHHRTVCMHEYLQMERCLEDGTRRGIPMNAVLDAVRGPLETCLDWADRWCTLTLTQSLDTNYQSRRLYVSIGAHTYTHNCMNTLTLTVACTHLHSHAHSHTCMHTLRCGIHTLDAGCNT